MYFARRYAFDPLIMCARLPLYQRFFPFYTLPIFPVDSILIPDRDLPPSEFPLLDRGTHHADYSQYFKPADIHLILEK
ncbi:MAG: hypothetical protein AAB414_04005 [Patescibacteria group bacterium]